MNSKKGFTLIELMVTIIIIGLIIVFAIPMYNNATGRTQEKAYQNKVALIENAAGNFSQEIKNEIKIAPEPICVTIEALIKQKYLISDSKDALYLTNPNPDRSENGLYMAGVVELTYNNGEIFYDYKIDSATCGTTIVNPIIDDRYIVDITPPAGTMLINEGDYTNNPDITLRIVPNDDAYEFCYNSVSNSCLTYRKLSEYNLNSIPYTLANLNEGNHTVYVWLRDKYLNVMTAPLTDSIIYDKTAPTGNISINSGVLYSNSRTVNLSLPASDLIAGVESMCISNSASCPAASWEPYNATKSWILLDAEGSQTVSVWYQDKSNNVSIKYSANIFLDRVKPVCTDSGDSTTWVQSRTIIFGCQDTGGSGCSASASGGSIPFTSTKKTSLIPAYIIADKAGNSTNCSSRTANVYVDTTKPSCIHSGDSTDWTASNRSINFGCSDSDSGCLSSASGGSKEFSATTKTATIAAYTIKDNANNSTSCVSRTANVYVDKTPPTCSWTDGSWALTTVPTITGNDADSGVAQISNGGAYINGSSTTASFSSTGDKFGSVKDNVGLEGSCKITIESRSEYRSATCSTYTSCQNDSCTWDTCLTGSYTCTGGNKTCETDACGCSVYNDPPSETLPTSCSSSGSSGDITYTACSVNSWNCNCWCRTNADTYPTWTTTSNRCQTKCESTASSSCRTGWIGGSENGVYKWKKSVYTCKTSKTCQHADCGWDSCLTGSYTCVGGYNSCPADVCGCTTWGAWSGWTTAACTASGNTTKCETRTTYQ